MRQSPTPDAVSRKDFNSAVVTSPGNDVMYRSADAYYNSTLYPPARSLPNVAGFAGIHEKVAGGSVFPHAGFGDPGSPMGYPSGGLQFKPVVAPSLHNGLRGHHDAALTHRPPSAASVSPSAAGAPPAMVDEKSPTALSPPLSSSPGSSPPPAAETGQGAAASGPRGTGDAAATPIDDSSASQQQQQHQQQQSPEPLIYPWMRRVHSGHGGKTRRICH